MTELGRGSFGRVFVRGDRAVKECTSSSKPARDMMKIEARVLRHLGDTRYVPRLFGVEGGDGVRGGTRLVMELLGPSLAQLQEQCGHLSTRQVLGVANNAILALGAIHAHDIVHRDLSPANFCFTSDPREAARRGRPCSLKVIDFGLAKSVRAADGSHTPPRRGDSPHVGTPRYVSIDVHDGLGVARRSDLQSLALVLLFLWRGRLPWQGMKDRWCTKSQQGPSEEHSKRVRDMKARLDREDGAFGGAPTAIMNLWRRARALRWDEAGETETWAREAAAERDGPSNRA